MKKVLLFAAVAAATMMGAQAQTIATDWNKAVQYVRTFTKDATPDLKAEVEQAIADNAEYQDIESLYLWSAGALMSSAKAEGIAGVQDMTELIYNPCAEYGLDGWENLDTQGNSNIVQDNRSGEMHEIPGCDIKYYFDGGNWNGSNWRVSFEQAIELESGKYRLGVIGRGSNNLSWMRLVAADDNEANRPEGHLINEATSSFANADIPHIGAAGTASPFNNGWFQSYVDFQTEGGVVVIAVQAEAIPTHEWMSFTHFTLVRIGNYGGTADLIAEANALLIDPEYAIVTGEERTNLQAIVANEAATVTDLTAAIGAFKGSKPQYEKWATAKANVANYETGNATAEEKAAIEALLGAAPANGAAASAAADELLLAIRAAVYSSAIGRGIQGYSDLTAKIPVVTVGENISLEGWTVEPIDGYPEATFKFNQGEAPVNCPLAGGKYYDMWASDMWGGRYSLTTESLPAGHYRVSVMARGRVEPDFYNMFVTSGANTKSIAVKAVGNQGGDFTGGWSMNYVDISTTEAGPLTFGIESACSNGGHWISYGDFHLSSFPAAPAGVEAVEADNNAPATYFDLQGRPVAGQLSNGLYIVRQGAKVSKIVVR